MKGAFRPLGAAAACGAAVGTAEAARALVALPHALLFDALALSIASVAGHASAAAVVALALLRWREREDDAALAGAGGIAVGVLVAILRLRALAGFAQPALALFVPGCLLEGIAAGLLARRALRPLGPRHQRRLFGALAGLAGAVALVVVSRPLVHVEASPPAARTLPNLLLVSIDTLRADRLGAWGRRPSITPNLDRLASEGVAFLDAVTPIALTGPAHTTMLTGLDPSHHGATANGVPLRPTAETVAERLARSGYRTGGFISGWPLVDRASGLARRFDTWDEDLARRPWLPRAMEQVPLVWLADRALSFAAAGAEATDRSGRFQGELDERPGERTVARALDWIGRSSSAPFFAFVHLYEPHDPYEPPPSFLAARSAGEPVRFDRAGGREGLAALLEDPAAAARVTALYDGEVAHVDAIVGVLLAGLERLGHSRDTLVVLTADHGESLTEHGELFTHGDFLYETTVHVPLLIRFPDRHAAGARLAPQVRLADLAPTLLEAARMRPAGTLDGASLLPLLAAGGAAPPRLAYGVRAMGAALRLTRAYVRDAGLKLIWTLDQRELRTDAPLAEELYDLRGDPGETTNLLSSAASAVLSRMRAQLANRLAQRGAPGREPDPETQRRLQSLGYL